LGGDPEQEYFVDGVTESLTTDLSRIRGMFVIARNTEWITRSINVNGSYPLPHFYLAIALANLDRLAEAHSEVQVGLSLDPNFTISRFRVGANSDNPTYLAQREHMYEGMRKAGVPEQQCFRLSSDPHSETRSRQPFKRSAAIIIRIARASPLAIAGDLPCRSVARRVPAAEAAEQILCRNLIAPYSYAQLRALMNTFQEWLQ
jgi:hypothetical protein